MRSALFVVLLMQVSSSIAQTKTQPITAGIDIEAVFTASGWIGDGEYGRKYLEFDGANSTNTHSPPTAMRFAYTFGPMRWGGMYWQNEPDNWCNKPGSNYTGKNVKRLSFWARGDTGTEVVEFKSGGIECHKKTFRDSYAATIGRVRLSREWTQYTLDLSKADLSSVMGAFAWVASADYNNGKRMIFYIDDLRFE